jgi:hypothetical protein
MKISDQQRFQECVRQQMAELRKQTANWNGTSITAYRGNPTGIRSRKLLRKLAREAARQIMAKEKQDAAR